MKKIMMLLFVYINSFLFSQSNEALNIQYLGDNNDKKIPYQFGINGPYFSNSICLSEDGYIYILQIDGILRKYDFNMNVVYSLNFNSIDNRVIMSAGQNLVKAIVKNNKIYIMCNGPLKDTKCFLVFSMEGELLCEKKGNFLGLEQASFYGFEIINEMIIIPDQQFPKFYYVFNYLNSNIDISKEFDIKKLYPENYQFTDNLYFENKIWNYLNNNCHGIWYDHFFYNLGPGHLTGFLLPYINNIDLESNKAVTIFNEIKYWYNNDEKTIGAGSGIDIMDHLYITYIDPNGNVLLYIFKNKKFFKKISGIKKNANEKILKIFVNLNGDILIWAEYIPEGENSWSDNIRLHFYRIPNTWDPIPDSTVQAYLDDLNKP